MGTSRFTAASLHDLPAVERNLHGLDRAFANETLWGLPAANRTVLHQPDGVEQALDAVRSAAMAATDTIVVYYAGHGLISEQSDELMLTLPRSDPARMYTSLPYAWLRNQLVHTATRARRKVIILDCCYAGRAGLDRMAPTGESIAQVVANQSMIEGACVLTATDAFTRAYAQSGAEYTAFTGALVEALTGGIPGPAALLDLTTLHVHLRDTLRSRGHPDPELRNRDTVGWVALARNVAHTVTEPGPGAVEQPPAIVRGVRDVGMIVETSLEQNVRRRRAGRDGGRVPDEQIGYVNHQLRQLTTTVGAVLRDLARPATVEDLAAVAAAHLGDPSVAQTLRTVNQAGQLRDLAVAVTTDGGIDAVRYALVAPIGLSIPAKVVWSAQGSRADLRNPTVL
ncbi:MAG TPA: caspase family protein, partial [Actinoplanes sp.]